MSFLVNPFRFAAPVAGATWNPADKDANVDLTNGNLTAAANTTKNFMGVRSTTTKAVSSHYEITVNAIPSGVYPAVGFANASFNNTTNYPGQVNSFGYFNDGVIRIFSVDVVTVDSFTVGDVIALEISPTTNEAWVEKLGGSGRKGPYDLTSGGQPGQTFANAFALVGFNTNGQRVTANFGQSAFAITPTSGFSAWS